MGIIGTLGFENPREGWKFAHLPGVGAYTLRIFIRNWLRDLECFIYGKDVVELKWKREPYRPIKTSS